MKKTSSNLICIAFVIVTLLAFISNDWILIKKDNYHIIIKQAENLNLTRLVLVSETQQVKTKN